MNSDGQSIDQENEKYVKVILDFTEIAAVVAGTFYSKIITFGIPPSDAGAITASFMSNYTASAAALLEED